MVLIVLSERDRTSAIKRLLARTGFIMLPLSVLFIKYYSDLGRVYDQWTWTPYYTGVTDNKNGLGAICLILGLGSVWRFLELARERNSNRRTRSLIAHGVILCIVGWLLWKANSITSLSCFAMGSTLIAVTHLRFVSRRVFIVHAIIFAMICFSLFALFADSGGGVLGAMGRNSTLTGRTDLWRAVLSLAGNPLIGTGFESFWLGTRLEKLWSQNWWHPNEAHNGYLETYLTLGWIGVGLLAALMVTGYRNAIRLFRRDPDCGRIALAYLVAAVLYNISEAALKGLNPIWIVFTLATLAVPARRAVRAPLSVQFAPPEGLTECGLKPVRLHVGSTESSLAKLV